MKACLIVDGRYIENSRKQTLYPVQLLQEGLLKELSQAIKSISWVSINFIPPIMPT